MNKVLAKDGEWVNKNVQKSQASRINYIKLNNLPKNKQKTQQNMIHKKVTRKPANINNTIWLEYLSWSSGRKISERSD